MWQSKWCHESRYQDKMFWRDFFNPLYLRLRCGFWKCVWGDSVAGGCICKRLFWIKIKQLKVAWQLLCIIDISPSLIVCNFSHSTALALPMAPFFSLLPLKIFQTPAKGWKLYKWPGAMGSVRCCETLTLFLCLSGNSPLMKRSCPSSICSKKDLKRSVVTLMLDLEEVCM